MNYPDNVKPISKEDVFCFQCHTKISCFNECCRELELALSPYDALRLRKKLNLSSTEFMDRHCIVEFTNDNQFPSVYLGMVDDGRASCPFVTGEGCLVYQDRPGACRTYPLGRGASMGKEKKVLEKYILITEQHCLGFSDKKEQTVIQWESNQEIQLFNDANDQLMSLTQHPKMRRGMSLTQDQADLFITALYHLDTFQKHPLFLEYIKLSNTPEDTSIDDAVVLKYAIEILAREFFK